MIPLILFYALWSLTISAVSRPITSILLLLIFVYEIIFSLVLDDSKDLKYKYAVFYLQDGTCLKNITTSTIRQKKDWIIAEDAQTHETHYFRTNDIKRVKYKN